MNTLGSFYKLNEEPELASNGPFDSKDQDNSGQQLQDNGGAMPLEQIPEEDFISRKGSQYPDELNKSKATSLKKIDSHQAHNVDVKRKPSYFDNQDRYLTSEDELQYSELPKKSAILLKTSLASITTYLGIGFLNLSQMVVIKNTNQTENIAAFGLGLTWINACSYAFIVAVNDGTRTISSQIYGAKKYKMLGIVYNQVIAISWIVMILSLALVLNSRRILVAFGIDENIAYKSQQFTIYGIPSLIGSIYFEASRQFLFSQKIFNVHMNGQLIAALLHPIWCYFLILYFDLGIEGAGIARSITFILSYFIVWVQMKYKQTAKESLQPFHFHSAFHFAGWIEILKVAVPAGGTNYLKWCSIECLAILVGNLPNKDSLAGHAAFFSINIFFSMFAKGIQTTVNAFVANAIGEAKVQLAKNLTTIAVSSTFLLCLILLVIGQVLRPLFVYLLTTTPSMESQFLIAYNMYLCVDIWGNFLQQVQAGILSGMNRQNDTISYYMWTFLVLQFIIAYVFGFYLKFGLFGVWLGRVAAGVVNSLCFMIILKRVNIEKEIENVRARLEKAKALHQENIKHLEEIEGNLE